MAVTGLGIVILLGARTRSLAVGLVVIVLGVGAVYGLAAAVGPRLDRAAGLSGDDISERNVSGLLHPLDPGQSSALSHWDNLEKNVVDGFQNPAGSGTASANAAGRNLANSGGAGRQTDNDVADVFLSLGAAGGLLYLTIMFFALRAVFSRYSREKDWMLFAVAGVLVVMVGNWLNGALYSLAPLTWFLLGWASRPSPAQEAEEQDEPDASARLQTFLRRLGGRRPARA
jgi:hypothetical protein